MKRNLNIISAFLLITSTLAATPKTTLFSSNDETHSNMPALTQQAMPDSPADMDPVFSAQKEVIANHIISVRTTLEFFTENNEEVLKQYDAFAARLSKLFETGQGMTHLDLHRILDSVAYSAEKHRFQKRKNPDKTPYIIHPIGVARNLIEVGNVHDPDILIAALLHDVVEDTDTPLAEIYQLFGMRIGEFVREVTDNKDLAKERRKQLQIENAGRKSAGAAQIKLADKLYNLNDLLNNPPADWDPARIDTYFQWAQEVTDHLPRVNPALKQAVDKTIETYQKKAS